MYLHRRLNQEGIFKNESQHQNILCIFVSSTVKILGLQKGSIAEFEKSRRGKRKKRIRMGQDWRWSQFIFSYQAFSDGRITFLSMLLSVKVAFHPPSTNKESYNGKVWLSFMPPMELANKYIAHLVKLLQFHDPTIRSVHSSCLSSKDVLQLQPFWITSWAPCTL